MMATYTRKQLRNAVLQELGVVDGSRTPSETDAVLADDRCQQHLEYLYDQGYIPFDLDGDAIPGRFFIPLTYVIAYRLSRPYGVTDQVLLQNAAVGQKELSMLKEHRYMGETQQAEYF